MWCAGHYTRQDAAAAREDAPGHAAACAGPAQGQTARMPACRAGATPHGRAHEQPAEGARACACMRECMCVCFGGDESQVVAVRAGTAVGQVMCMPPLGCWRCALWPCACMQPAEGARACQAVKVFGWGEGRKSVTVADFCI
eukprot:1157219-Pelagomonas_calceolata.AAC.5